MKALNLGVLFLITANYCYSQSSSINIMQYENCEEIDWVNIDSLTKEIPFSGVTLFIFRAEASKHDGVDLISPLIDNLVPFDSSVIRIFSFELKNARYSGSCMFKVKVNDREVVSKGSPPFAYVVATNPIDQLYLLSSYRLKIANSDSSTLILNSTYQTHGQFYNEINTFLSDYGAVTHFENRIQVLNRQIFDMRREYSENKVSERFISFGVSPNHLNTTKLNVFNPFGDTITTSQQTSSSAFAAMDFYPFKIGKNSFGFGFDFGRHQFALNSTMKNGITIIDTVNKSAFDGTDHYTRVAYAIDISEHLIIYRSFVGGHLNYKFQPNPFLLFDFTLGIRLLQINSSRYSFNSGQVSFGGIYPQYHSKDTMFSGSERFEQNVGLATDSRELEIRTRLASYTIGGRVSLAPFSKASKFGKNCYLFTGFFFEVSSPLMNNELTHNSRLGISHTDVQSTWYRYQIGRMLNRGVVFGLNYRLR